MLCKISNDRETIVINNFKDLDEAKKCFPESVVEACNETIDYSSYNEYIKSLINKMHIKYPTQDYFKYELRKITHLSEDAIKFENDENTNKEGSIIIYLANDMYLEYEFYIDDFGDFSIGDLKDEDEY